VIPLYCYLTSIINLCLICDTSVGCMFTSPGSCPFNFSSQSLSPSLRFVFLVLNAHIGKIRYISPTLHICYCVLQSSVSFVILLLRTCSTSSVATWLTIDLLFIRTLQAHLHLMFEVSHSVQNKTLMPFLYARNSSLNLKLYTFI